MKDYLLDALQDMNAIIEDPELPAKEVQSAAMETAGDAGWFTLHASGYLQSVNSEQSIITPEGVKVLSDYGLI